MRDLLPTEWETAVPAIVDDLGTVDDQVIDVPEGCVNPGHALWLADDPFCRVAISCNGSGTLAVIPIDLDS